MHRFGGFGPRAGAKKVRTTDILDSNHRYMYQGTTTLQNESRDTCAEAIWCSSLRALQSLLVYCMARWRRQHREGPLLRCSGVGSCRLFCLWNGGDEIASTVSYQGRVIIASQLQVGQVVKCYSHCAQERKRASIAEGMRQGLRCVGRCIVSGKAICQLASELACPLTATYS